MRRSSRHHLLLALVLPLAVAALAALAHLVPPVLAADIARADKEDHTIMRRLRQSLFDSDGHWIVHFAGWNLWDTSTHCSWEGVECDAKGRVTHIYLSVRKLVVHAEQQPSGSRNRGSLNTTRSGQPGPMLPELARLSKLQEYIFRTDSHGSSWGPFPPEWCEPGSFPSLTWLSLTAASLAAPLPDIAPGAFPALGTLDLDFVQLRSTLPASWGASPDVLPSLQVLSLQLRVVGTLPTQWAVGFHSLMRLEIVDACYKSADMAGSPGDSADRAYGMMGGSTEESEWQLVECGGGDGGSGGEGPGQAGNGDSSGSAASLPPAPGVRGPPHAAADEAPATATEVAAARTLPPEWADGFPSLASIALMHLGLVGSLPDSWTSSGGLWNLTSLSLQFNFLEGSLPEGIWAAHPLLQNLLLTRNRLSGTLPDSWGASKATALDLSYNYLTGPAFPPSWLAQGALPELKILSLAGNRGLRGKLPANLHWPRIVDMRLSKTDVRGRIPATWCKAPFRYTMKAMFIEQTGIEASVPQCIGEKLALGFLELHASPPAPHHPALHASTLLPALASLVFLGGLGVRRLVKRRSRQQLVQPNTSSASRGSSCAGSGGSQQLEHAQALLPAWCPGTDLPPSDFWAAGSSKDSNSRSNASSEFSPADFPEPSFVPSERQERLAALLAGSLKPNSRRLDVLAPAARGEVPSHHVLAGIGSAGGMGGMGGSVFTQAATLGGGAAAAAASTAKEDAGWKWGLQTHSLQVKEEELEFVTDGNGRLVVLGAGSYAVVYLARLNGGYVAAKVFELHPDVSCQSIWQEVCMLRRCENKRIVSLRGVAIKGQLLVMAMQIMRGGSLRAALKHPQTHARLAWEVSGWRVAVDVAEGLCFLHNQLHIMHSDLKSSNVLLCKDLRASLADLGAALVTGSRAMTAAFFSCTHAAPEQLMGQRCTLAADMYSFGILLVELTTRTPVNRRADFRLPLAPQECPQGVLRLIERCLSLYPEQRPTAAEALQQLWGEGGLGEGEACTP